LDILSQTDIIFLIIVMIFTAIPAGFAAGLFGIGGGLITVPILFYIFTKAGINTSFIMHLSVGTSFGIIIPTAFVSVLTHYQHNAVDFKVVRGFGLSVVTGVILGTILAANLKTKPLILYFTIVVYSLAFYLLFLKEKGDNLDIKIGFLAKTIAGIVSGFVSAPMGIGGAVMNVPILKYFGYPINTAIGSAAAIGFVIASCGAIGFLLSGHLLEADIPLSIGFLTIPVFLIFFPITAYMARLGAQTSHRLDKKKLTKYFGIFLIFVGSRFLFEYIRL